MCERCHLVHSHSRAYSGEIWTITVIEGGNFDTLGTIHVMVAEPLV